MIFIKLFRTKYSVIGVIIVISFIAAYYNSSGISSVKTENDTLKTQSVGYKFISNFTNANRRTGLGKQCKKHQLRNNSLYKFADKHFVKTYVKSIIPDIRIASEYAYVSASVDITNEFISKLPNIYVMKPNHMCGETIIVKDGQTKCYTNLAECFSCKTKGLLYCFRKNCNIWLNKVYSKGFETYYESIKRKCIFEEYLETDGHRPIDYKIHTYNGKAYIVQIDDTLENGYLVDYFTPNFKRINMERTPGNWPRNNSRTQPKFWSKMLNYTKSLAKPFKMMRIDFFGFKGEFGFAEFSPSPNGCNTRYVPSVYETFFGIVVENPDMNIDPESVLLLETNQ